MAGFSFILELEADAFDGVLPPERVRLASQRAINKTAERMRTRISKEVRSQVSFPASYLAPSAGRLTVAEKAKAGHMQAIIRGRDRATSLARFVRGAANKDGVRVSVKGSGGSSRIKRAFIVKNLRGGNTGLAVRTDGGPPDGAHKPTRLGENVWLLYGPSVAQVLYGVQNDGGVYGEITGELLDFLNAEFLRLIDLEVGDGA